MKLPGFYAMRRQARRHLLGSVIRILTVTFTLCLLVVFLRPLRNTLIPPWPKAWRDLSTLQVVSIHISLIYNYFPPAPVRCLQDTIGQLAADRDAHSNGILARTGNTKVGKRNTKDATLTNSEVLQLNVNAAETFSHAYRWLNVSSERRAKYERFLPMMTVEDKARLLRTWRVLDSACHQANISYFLVDGSLLGARRHAGVIPWDDDMDVAMDVRDATKILQALSCVPGYKLKAKENMHWKFYATDGARIPRLCPPEEKQAPAFGSMSSSVTGESECERNAVRYPFVDIFIYTSDGTYIWALTSYISSFLVYRTEDVFPLTELPFEGFMAPVPHNTTNVMKVIADSRECKSPCHNHRLNKALESHEVSSVPCRDLAEMYPMFNI